MLKFRISKIVKDKDIGNTGEVIVTAFSFGTIEGEEIEVIKVIVKLTKVEQQTALSVKRRLTRRYRAIIEEAGFVLKKNIVV